MGHLISLFFLCGGTHHDHVAITGLVIDMVIKNDIIMWKLLALLI